MSTAKCIAFLLSLSLCFFVFFHLMIYCIESHLALICPVYTMSVTQRLVYAQRNGINGVYGDHANDIHALVYGLQRGNFHFYK